MSDDGFPVFRFTQEAYDQLLEVAKESPDSYLDPHVDFANVLSDRGVTEFTETTSVSSTRPLALVPATDGPPNRADAQAMAFYETLVGVTPRIATDCRMWAWITHFKLHAYSLQRWRRNRSTDLARYIKAHWFVRPGEGLWLYNTAARTWWIAHTAKKAAAAAGGAFTAEEALDDFATYAVHYHIVMTKYSFARSPRVLSELVRALLNEAQGMKAEAGLYALTRHLNLDLWHTNSRRAAARRD